MARLRAPRDPDPESFIENLVSMVRTNVTWAKFIDICRETKVGAYRSRVTDLKAALLRNVGGVHVSRRMARLDVWRAVTLFLQLARDNLHLPGDYPRYLGVFIHGANVDAYVPHGCVTICLTLPTTRRPHQLDSILRVGQSIRKEKPNQLRMRIDRLGLIEAFRDAGDGHPDGHRYRLVHYRDWGCLGSVLATEAPGHQNACIACPVSRDDWKRYGFDTQAERSLGYYDTPLRSFLDLFESPLDVRYDVSHGVKDVVINMGLHGMDLWLQDHNPALVPELRSIFKAHTKKKEYVPPFD